MKLRPSALPVIMHCNAAVTLPEIVEERSAAMEAGSLRHEKLAAMPEKALEAVQRVLPEWSAPFETEVALEFDGISGTSDAVSESGNTGVVLDYKGEHDTFDPWDQLKIYALGARASIDNFALVVAHVDDDLTIKHVEWSHWVRSQLLDWHATLKAHLSAPPTFSVGSWCSRCTSFRCCPAQSGLLSGIVPLKTGELTPSVMGKVWETIANWERAIEKAKEIIKARAATEAIPLPSGGTLQEIEVAKESIDAEKAVKLLPDLPVKLSIAKGDVSQEQLVALRLGGATRTRFEKQVRKVR